MTPLSRPCWEMGPLPTPLFKIIVSGAPAEPPRSFRCLRRKYRAFSLPGMRMMKVEERRCFTPCAAQN